MRVRAKTPQNSEGWACGGDLAGHAESLRLCGVVLGACVGMSARHHSKREKGGEQQRGGGRDTPQPASTTWSAGGSTETLEGSTEDERAQRSAGVFFKLRSASLEVPTAPLERFESDSEVLLPTTRSSVASRSDRARRGQAHLLAGGD